LSPIKKKELSFGGGKFYVFIKFKCGVVVFVVVTGGN